MNIKIDYKNKLHSIGKDNTSLNQIAEAIKTRYPGEFKNGVIIAVIDNGNVNEVTDFKQIVDFWKKNGETPSVKVKVFEAPENTGKQEEVKQTILECADPIYTESVYEVSEPKDKRVPENSDVYEIQEQPKVHEEKISNPFLKNKELDQSMQVQKRKLENKNDYQCWKCKGDGAFNNLFASKCQICSGSGVLKFGDPFFNVVNQIVEDRVRNILLEYGIVPIVPSYQPKIEKNEKIIKTENKQGIQKVEQSEIKRIQEKYFGSTESMIKDIDKIIGKIQDAPVEKPKIQTGQKKLQLPKQYKVKFTQPPVNIVKSEANNSYVWKVNFTNNGEVAWPKGISVYKTSNKMLQITEVKSLSPGESTEIVIDMIAPSSKGIESKQFRLGYIDESNSDSLTFFGPKFGFQLDTQAEEKNHFLSQIIQKSAEKIEQQDTELIRKVIEAAKHVANQRHSIKLLVKYIKQLGFDANTSRDFLFDIIVQLQDQTLY